MTADAPLGTAAPVEILDRFFDAYDRIRRGPSPGFPHNPQRPARRSRMHGVPVHRRAREPGDLGGGDHICREHPVESLRNGDLLSVERACR